MMKDTELCQVILGVSIERFVQTNNLGGATMQ